MVPKTFYGWYNVIVRGYAYNDKTATILDDTFRPSPRLMSIVDRHQPRRRVRKNKNSKATRAAVKSLLKQQRKGVRMSEWS